MECSEYIEVDLVSTIVVIEAICCAKLQRNRRERLG